MRFFLNLIFHFQKRFVKKKDNSDRRPYSILFLFNGGLGDACHVIPILFALREKYHPIQIEMIFATGTSKDFVQIFFPDTVGIIVSDLNTVKKKVQQVLKWRRKSFDYVVSGAHLRSLKTAIIAYLIGGKKSIGIGGEKFSFLYDIILTSPNSKYFYDRYEILFGHLKLHYSDLQYGEKKFREELKRIAQIHVPRGLGQRKHSLRIAFGNGADRIIRGRWNPSLKRIPKGLFLDVSKILKHEIQVEFVLLGGKGDPFPDALESDSCVLDMRGKTNLQGLISMLHHVNLLICNDCGILHLAHYCGTSYLGLFGPTDAEQFGPSKASSNIIQAQGICSKCYPIPSCDRDYCELLASLDVGLIISLVQYILQHNYIKKETQDIMVSGRET